MTLLYQKVWILDIHIHTSKECLYFWKIWRKPIHEYFWDFVLSDLTGDYQLITVLVTWGAMIFIGTFKSDGYWGFLNSCESFFVDELTESTLKSKHLFAGWTEEKLNSIEDVALARTIETSDGVKVGVEIGYHGPVHVGFETLQDNLVDVHENCY